MYLCGLKVKRGTSGEVLVYWIGEPSKPHQCGPREIDEARGLIHSHDLQGLMCERKVDLRNIPGIYVAAHFQRFIPSRSVGQAGLPSMNK